MVFINRRYRFSFPFVITRVFTYIIARVTIAMLTEVFLFNVKVTETQWMCTHLQKYFLPRLVHLKISKDSGIEYFPKPRYLGIGV